MSIDRQNARRNPRLGADHCYEAKPSRVYQIGKKKINPNDTRRFQLPKWLRSRAKKGKRCKSIKTPTS